MKDLIKIEQFLKQKLIELDVYDNEFEKVLDDESEVKERINDVLDFSFAKFKDTVLSDEDNRYYIIDGVVIHLDIWIHMVGDEYDWEEVGYINLLNMSDFKVLIESLIESCKKNKKRSEKQQKIYQQHLTRFQQ